MRLVIAVVQNQDVNKLLVILGEQGFSATKLASTGGFLRQGNTTLLIGVETDKASELLELIKAACHARQQLMAPLAEVGRSLNNCLAEPVEVTVGGATIFLVDVLEFLKI